MAQEPVREGYDVFVHDGDTALGAVRRVSRDTLRIYFENVGEFEVPLSAVTEVEAGKVVLDCARLERGLARALGHAHAAEDPNVADET